MRKTQSRRLVQCLGCLLFLLSPFGLGDLPTFFKKILRFPFSGSVCAKKARVSLCYASLLEADFSGTRKHGKALTIFFHKCAAKTVFSISKLNLIAMDASISRILIKFERLIKYWEVTSFEIESLVAISTPCIRKK